MVAMANPCGVRKDLDEAAEDTLPHTPPIFLGLVVPTSRWVPHARVSKKPRDAPSFLSQA